MGPPSLPPEVADKVLEVTAADEVLGIGTDDLKSQLDPGETLADILEDKGVSEDEMQAALQEAFQFLAAPSIRPVVPSDMWLSGLPAAGCDVEA